MAMYSFNGQLFTLPQDGMPLASRSFKFGDGVFESIRVYRKRPLFLEDHWARLQMGMDALGIMYERNWQTNLTDWVYQLIEALAITSHGKLRVQAFRKGEGTYLPQQDAVQFYLEGGSLKDDYYLSHAPMSLTTYRDWPLVPHPLMGCKTANSLPYIMAAKDAKARGFDEAVLFHLDGQLAEASSANVFYIYQKKLYTPPLSSGCLDGVMRKQVFGLAEEIKLPLIEKKSRAKDLMQADEVFLTNTIRGIIPVSRFENRLYPTEFRVLTAFLQKCLRQLVQAA